MASTTERDRAECRVRYRPTGLKKFFYKKGKLSRRQRSDHAVITLSEEKVQFFASEPHNTKEVLEIFLRPRGWAYSVRCKASVRWCEKEHGSRAYRVAAEFCRNSPETIRQIKNIVDTHGGTSRSPGSDKELQVVLLQLVTRYNGDLVRACREQGVSRSALRRWQQSPVIKGLLRFCEGVGTMSWGSFLKQLDDYIEDERNRPDADTEWLAECLHAIQKGHLRKEVHKEVLEFANKRKEEGVPPRQAWEMAQDNYPDIYNQPVGSIIREF